MFTAGTHQVTYTARDAAGNRAHCSFIVLLAHERSSAPARSSERKPFICPERKPGTKVQPILYPVRILYNTKHIVVVRIK
jgi:hypothetical protein